jgi:hypothetical protein
MDGGIIDAVPEQDVRGAVALRHVTLRIDPTLARRFHRELAIRLARETGARVSFARGTSAALPASVELLFSLERLTRRLSGPRLSDRIAVVIGDVDQAEPADLVIDLCGGDTPAGARVLRLVYNGEPGETALLGGLVVGRMPLIEIEDAESGAIVASGMPGADNAATVLEAFEHALARAATLIAAMARGQGPTTAAPRPAARPPALRDIARFEGKAIAHSFARQLYHLCCHAPHWQTRWRFVQGADTWQSRSLTASEWQAIPDPGFRFYADPFAFVHAGRHYLFVEDLDHRTNKGVISVVPFDDHGPCGEARPVLEEPWHLSYPFVFAHAGQIWMIPESSANRTVSLYRAESFPHRWVRESTLLTGIAASDATVICHAGRFWMFAATRDGAGSWSDTLSLFLADDIRGPWRPHPANPVLIDQASARPAGAIVERDGVLWRPVQDCTNGYGTGVGLAEITRLDQEGFAQKVRNVLRWPAEWPGHRFHTLNRAGHLECIDGAAHSPRSRLLARMLLAG